MSGVTRGMKGPKAQNGRTRYKPTVLKLRQDAIADTHFMGKPRPKKLAQSSPLELGYMTSNT